jgi:hypothetical protein
MSAPQKTITVTFKLIGPLKRSTIGSADPDPAKQALDDALFWLWSSRLQMTRLRGSFLRELPRKGVPPLASRRRFARTSYDEHSLLVAACNLDRAFARAHKIFPSLQLSASTRRALRLLRNIYEHWEEHRDAFRKSSRPKSNSGEQFLKEFPTGDPWSFTFDPKSGNIVLADVVSLKEFRSDLRKLEAKLSFLEKTLGKP